MLCYRAGLEDYNVDGPDCSEDRLWWSDPFKRTFLCIVTCDSVGRL